MKLWKFRKGWKGIIIKIKIKENFWIDILRKKRIEGIGIDGKIKKLLGKRKEINNVKEEGLRDIRKLRIEKYLEDLIKIYKRKKGILRKEDSVDIIGNSVGKGLKSKKEGMKNIRIDE